MPTLDNLAGAAGKAWRSANELVANQNYREAARDHVKGNDVGQIGNAGQGMERYSFSGHSSGDPFSPGSGLPTLPGGGRSK